MFSFFERTIFDAIDSDCVLFYIQKLFMIYFEHSDDPSPRQKQFFTASLICKEKNIKILVQKYEF